MEVERERERGRGEKERERKSIFPEREKISSRVKHFSTARRKKRREKGKIQRDFFFFFFLFPRRENHGSFLSRETYRLENSLIGHGSTDTGYRRLSGWRMRSAFKTVFQRYVGILSRGKCAACKNIPRCSSFLRDGERHSMPRIERRIKDGKW